MAKAKKEAAAPVPQKNDLAPAKSAEPASSLADRVTEVEGDLRRIVELLIKGDLDSAKFREILDKKQGR